MRVNNISDRLRDILCTIENCPDGELSEIERDVLLAGLRDLYAVIKYDRAAGRVVPANIPEEAAMSAYETGEAIVETLAAGFAGDAAEAQEKSNAGDDLPQQEEPCEAVGNSAGDEGTVPEPVGNGTAYTGDAGEVVSVPDEELRSVGPRPENTHRKAILSLYDEDAPVPSILREEPESGIAQPEPSEFFDSLDEDRQTRVADELFGGDMRECREAMEVLSRFDDLDDALVYIHENYKWNPDSEGAEIVADLLVDRLA